RPEPVDLQPQLAVRGVARLVQVEGDLVVAGAFEPLQAAQVGHGRLGREVGLVALGEGVVVALDQPGGLFFGGQLADGRAEVVLPGAGGGGQARLQLLDVHGRLRELPAPLAADDHVQPGERGIPYRRAVVERLAAQRLHQQVLHPQADLGGVAVARQVDQAGDVAAVVVAAQEQLDLLALAQPQHAERDRQQLADRDLEQLVAGERLQYLDEVLAVVALRGEPGGLYHGLQLAAQHRDARDRLVVGDVREQAEEAALADDLALGGEELDADVVEVAGAVHGGARVGLGDDEQLLLAGPGAQLGRERGEALGVHLVVTQYAERRARQRAEGVAPLAALQPVLAVAEEREVAVGQPAEQVDALLDLR